MARAGAGQARAGRGVVLRLRQGAAGQDADGRSPGRGQSLRRSSRVQDPRGDDGKIPYVLVVGDKEMQNGSVNVRSRGPRRGSGRCRSKPSWRSSSRRT
ncbi:MAG: His/Gly/Thr/Pro-type tRNA ligase C-terminal domain-containing protein [Candidatus Eisenbacteria bacterium]